MKAHHSAGRDHHSFARAGVPSLASALTSNRERAKAVDGDWFTRLKGGLEEFKEPVQQGGCLRLRDPGLLMNSPGNVRLLHRRSVPLRQSIIIQTSLGLEAGVYSTEVAGSSRPLIDLNSLRFIL